MQRLQQVGVAMCVLWMATTNKEVDAAGAAASFEPARIVQNSFASSPSPPNNALLQQHQLLVRHPFIVIRICTAPLFRLAKRHNTRNEEDNDFIRWYNAVDETATPDEVFWGEMELQILVNGGEVSLARLIMAVINNLQNR
jgi:hypothetical protein